MAVFARWCRSMALALAAGLLLPAVNAGADPAAIKAAVDSVVRLHAEVPGDARSAATLGPQREGNGIVIDDAGLVLTIGYLIVEASAVTLYRADGSPVPADVVGYDYDTGFGLVRALAPLRIKPIAIGKSAGARAGDPVLAVGHGGAGGVLAAEIVARREFAGYWEYLLEEAIFTIPPHPNWGGAALVDRDGKLVGVGSLAVGNATEADRARPGNMFVPIDLLPPVLADLIEAGKGGGRVRPWLGINVMDMSGHPIVVRVTPDSPAEKAGIEPGDVIVQVGGRAVGSVPDLYRRLWASGEAGVTIELEVVRRGAPQGIRVESASRYDHLKLKRTY
ncbi:S1C family serine protease [Desertibaculum subflavum]|uniref:S1C family serine protease n=1 Tax=Desertibaculum subflavum TaxID=2268458 RepID=UPI0013C52994